MMRENSFGNGILLNGTGCHLCHSLEPIGEGVIELSYNALIQTAHLGCQGCWVLSEAVTKCCPAFLDLAFFDILVKVQRPMLRDFIEIVVQNPENNMSITLDLFSDPGMYSIVTDSCMYRLHIVYTDYACAWSSVRVGSALSGNAMSQETFDNVMS